MDVAVARLGAGRGMGVARTGADGVEDDLVEAGASGGGGDGDAEEFPLWGEGGVDGGEVSNPIDIAGAQVLPPRAAELAEDLGRHTSDEDGEAIRFGIEEGQIAVR
jgi:hypothetical protein